MKFETVINGQTLELTFDIDRNRVDVNGEEYNFSFKQANGRLLLRVGTKLYKIDNVQYNSRMVEFTLNGSWCKATVRDEQELLLDRLGFKAAAEIGEGEIHAPMPGKILELLVEEGDKVKPGDPVVILEAMKMENELKSPIEGIVASLAVAAGDSVEKNALILEIKESG